MRSGYLVDKVLVPNESVFYTIASNLLNLRIRQSAGILAQIQVTRRG
jgi:hypothetical protein